MRRERRHIPNAGSIESQLTDAPALVLRDTALRRRGDRDMYYRIIRALGYDPADVCELRVTEGSIVVSYVDFTRADWPRLTRRHTPRLASSPS
jgi:hypothetical protein